MNNVVAEQAVKLFAVRDVERALALLAVIQEGALVFEPLLSELVEVPEVELVAHSAHDLVVDSTLAVEPVRVRRTNN